MVQILLCSPRSTLLFAWSPMVFNIILMSTDLFTKINSLYFYLQNTFLKFTVSQNFKVVASSFKLVSGTNTSEYHSDLIEHYSFLRELPLAGLNWIKTSSHNDPVTCADVDGNCIQVSSDCCQWHVLLIGFDQILGYGQTPTIEYNLRNLKSWSSLDELLKIPICSFLCSSVE